MASPRVANTASTLAASRYTGASSDRRNSASSTSVTAMMASATRPRSANTEPIESPVSAVWPAISNRASGSPAARPSAGRSRCSCWTRLIAVASSGSVFSTTTNRAAPPEAASIGLSWAGRTGPD